MIYTIVPTDQILEPENSQTSKRSPLAMYMGESVLLTQNGAGEYSIERLISTNPQSYLKNEFSPGASVDIKKIKF